MKNQQKKPVKNATPKTCGSITDILSLAQSYVRKREYDAARILFERALTNCRGMLEYARFLLTVPALESMKKYERMRKAEELLLYVERNGSKQEAGQACRLLSGLYRHRKEIRSLGFLMRANRYGDSTDCALSKELLERITHMEISDVERDPYGCYIAGTECSEFVRDPVLMDWALYFLEVAIENGQGRLAGLAAMRMADLQESHFGDREMYAHYKQIAEQNGNPDVLTKS